MIGISPVMIRSVRGMWAFDGDEKGFGQPSAVEQMLAGSPSNMGKLGDGKDEGPQQKGGKKGHARMDSSADPIVPKQITRVIKHGADPNFSAALPEAAAKVAGAAPAPNAAAPGAAQRTDAVPPPPPLPLAAAAAPATVAAPTAAAAASGSSASPFAKEPVVARPAAATTGACGSPAPVVSSGLSRELSETGMLRSFHRTPNPAVNDKNGGHVSISGGFMHGGENSDAAAMGSGRGVKQPNTPTSPGGNGGGAPGKDVKLKVFVAMNGEPVAGGALKLVINDGLKVSDVIAAIVREYAKAGRQPALANAAYGADAYELRMVDDDDGTPDDDMPPLERSSAFSKFQVDQVALVPKPGFSAGAADAKAAKAAADAKAAGAVGGRDRGMSAAGGPGTPTSAKILLKIHLPNFESHVLPCTRDMVLEDLLPIISKKKKTAKLMLPKAYKFLYLHESESSEGTLEMKTAIAELKSEELKLVSKFGAGAAGAGGEAEYNPAPAAGAAAASASVDPDPSQFQFTAETAGAYSEYKVVKTNQRGRKQNRVMGVDKQYVYNKQEIEQRDTASNSTGGASSMRATASSIFASITSKSVAKDKRPISTVASCGLVKGKPRTFQVTFKDGDKADANREYEAETKMEAAEIVAKINFLVRMLQGKA